MPSLVFGTVIGMVFGLVIMFIPTAIAFLRKNTYFKQVLIYQILMFAASIVATIFLALFGGFIGVIINAIWSLFSFGMWIYILYNAIKDYEMKLLKRFGINI